MPSNVPIQFPARYCEICHGRMIRKRHPCGRMEKVRDFKRRIFCSRRCHIESRKRVARAEQLQWRQFARKYVAA